MRQQTEALRYERLRNGRLQLDLLDEPDWFAFERLAAKITQSFAGKVITRLDGPHQRYWDIDIGGAVVTLHLEDSLGICLFPVDEAAEEIIKRIGEAFGLPFEESEPCPS